MKKLIKFHFIIACSYCFLGCHSQKVFINSTLPAENKFNKVFFDRLKGHKRIFETISKDKELNEIYPQSFFSIKDKPADYVFDILENETEYVAIEKVTFWVVHNYKVGIKGLIERITNNSKINKMNLASEMVSGNDISKVSGRANHILTFVLRYGVGEVAANATKKDLLKLQCKWIKWYNDMCKEIVLPNYKKIDKMSNENTLEYNKIFSECTLPAEDKLPKRFNEKIKRIKTTYYKYSGSISPIIKDKPKEYIFNIIEFDKKPLLYDVKCWLAFNYKTGIQELLKRITNNKEVGFEGSVNLIIYDRVLSGDMNLESGNMIEDDLFKVSGRANHLLKEITGEDFGNAGMYASEIELIKLQRKWIKWYSQICEKN